MRVYKREKYLKRIRGFFHDTGIIKVITGVRRCGKSCLMQSIADELSENGISKEQIIYINLDKKGYRSIKTPDELEAKIDELCISDGTKYLFIDEVQNVDGFEEVINAFREEGDYSIFITGSNSYLLSGELTTKLTGRYIEFELFTLSFDEYLAMKSFLNKDVSDINAEFSAFLLHGGFPKTLEYDSPEDKRTYVKSVIDEIFEKDIKKRVKIRKVSAFKTIQTYIINNFGSTTSLTNMLDDLRKVGNPIKRETLNRYIQILIDAKIIYPCERFDLKSRRSISGEVKYYLADLGFYYSPNTNNTINYGPVLENIVYSYARSQNYSVSVGRIGKLECDFILRNNAMQYAYIQVAMTILNSKDNEDREYRSLEKINDNYPKYVLTMDSLIQKRNGIIHENVLSFMRDGKLFN